MSYKEIQALEVLIKLIDSGIEFPEAIWKVSEKYGIDGEALTELYDESCS